jgi:hypothetical protein
MKDKSSFCPRCFKVFSNSTHLLQHMSQPYASCRLRFEAPYSLLPQHLQGRAGTGTVPAVKTPTLKLDPDVLGMGQKAAWAGSTAMNTEEEDIIIRKKVPKI